MQTSLAHDDQAWAFINSQTLDTVPGDDAMGPDPGNHRPQVQSSFFNKINFCGLVPKMIWSGAWVFVPRNLVTTKRFLQFWH